MSEIIAVVEYENNITVPAVGIQGLSASDLSISQFPDVDSSNLVNGSVLVYKTTTNKWTSTTTLDLQNVEAGEF